jgi:hypothetical protein
MLVIKRMAGLHRYEYATVYEEICFIISGIDPVIEDLDALLLNHFDLGLTQFMGKCIFVNPLQEPWAQFVGHPKTAANDQFGQWILDGHNFLPDSYLPQNPGRFSRG